MFSYEINFDRDLDTYITVYYYRNCRLSDNYTHYTNSRMDAVLAGDRKIARLIMTINNGTELTFAEDQS